MNKEGLEKNFKQALLGWRLEGGGLELGRLVGGWVRRRGSECVL